MNEKDKLEFELMILRTLHRNVPSLDIADGDKVFVFVCGGNGGAISRSLLDKIASETGCNDWEYIHIPKEKQA